VSRFQNSEQELNFLEARVLQNVFVSELVCQRNVWKASGSIAFAAVCLWNTSLVDVCQLTLDSLKAQLNSVQLT